MRLSMRCRLCLGAAATALLLALACGREPATDERYGRCTEDMPCWNCDSMGNLICGLSPAGEGAP